ncbi:MAG: pirin family protein [Saprospiraceae bacterium]|nr:pirin family protein [Saprospiraceae bacterium]
MERKEFIKKGMIGFGMVASGAFHKLIKSDIKDDKALNPFIEHKSTGINQKTNTSSKFMAKTILHKAETRGHANHGWLDSHHTFSFADYYNPERMNFGVLRVLNDDVVSGGMGFGKHSHDNMEIVSIPLEGDLEHQDSMGNIAVIKKGDIQVMSAGSGIMHSEKNKNLTQEVKFLQIWVLPNKKNVKPRYDQITIQTEDIKNNLLQILSPNPDDEGVWIHQDAWFHFGNLDEGNKQIYKFKRTGNGLYVFVISGEVTVETQKLSSRDGIGIWDVDAVNFHADKNCEILLMEVPMLLG